MNLNIDSTQLGMKSKFIGVHGYQVGKNLEENDLVNSVIRLIIPAYVLFHTDFVRTNFCKYAARFNF